MIELSRQDEILGRADTYLTYGPVNADKLGRVTFFYFPVLNLEPPILLRHISGSGLSTVLDGAKMVDGDKVVPRLRYVHGKSEIYRGNVSITCVLFVRLDNEYDEEVLRSSLPELRRLFISRP